MKTTSTVSFVSLQEPVQPQPTPIPTMIGLLGILMVIHHIYNKRWW
jgi:hypothetical protein